MNHRPGRPTPFLDKALAALALAFCALAASPAAAREAPAAGAPAAISSKAVEAGEAGTAPGARSDPPPLGAPAPQKVATVEGLTEYRWPNGLRAVLGPDPSRPTLTANLVYRVGSRHEGPGEAGMAHLLEHMLFRPTAAHPDPKGEFTRRGMRWNGTTSYDRTNYFAQFGAEPANLAWMLGWLADTMVNVKVDDDALARERVIVRSEMEASENRPQRVLFQQLMGTAYRFHPYSRSVIGTESDLAAVAPAQLQAFYERYYRPDNAVLVVTGQFDEATTLAAIGRTLGSIVQPASPIAQPYTLDRAQEGEREVILRRVGGVPLFASAYHITPGASRDTVALSLYASMMTRQPDGVLYEALVKTGLAVNVYAYPIALHDPGVLQFSATLPADGDRRRVLDTITRLVEGSAPLTQASFERSRRDMENDTRRIFESADDLGIALTEAIALGDWRLLYAQRDWLRDMTLQDVVAASKRYLLRDNRSVAWYLPTAEPQRAPRPVRADVAALLADHAWTTAKDFVADVALTPETIAARTLTGTLEPGIRYAMLPRRTKGDRVHVNLQLQWGDLASLSGRWREADLLGRMLQAGTTTLSLQQFEDRLRALDARLDVDGSETGVELSLQVGRAQLADALRIAIDAVRNPVFPKDVFEERRARLISSLESSIDQPDQKIGDAIREASHAYPQDDPRHYRDIARRIADLRVQTPERLAAFYRDFANASHGQLAIVGEFDADEVKRIVSAGLGEWRGDRRYARIERPFHPLAAARRIITTPDKANAVYVALHRIELGEEDPEYPALALAVRMLGGSAGSRIAQRLREQEGLSYGAYASLSADRKTRSGAISIRAIHAPSNLAKLEAALAEVLKRVAADGFDAHELADARGAWLQQRSRWLTDESNVSNLLASNLFWGRDMQWWRDFDGKLERATIEDVNAAIRRYLPPDALFVVDAGDYGRRAATSD
ncbi:MAG: M16 family metallopeptidase [Lautropia sp.]